MDHLLKIEHLSVGVQSPAGKVQAVRDERYKLYPYNFSGGMRQRSVMAIALAANPQYPDTQALLSAIPDPVAERNRKRMDFDEMDFDRDGTMAEVVPGHFVLRKEDGQ